MRPFLKWPGGKRWLVSKYSSIFPTEYNVYFEPFLGGGSAFFFLRPENAVISDINEDLINVYQMMTKSPAALRELMMAHQAKHCASYYYQVRNILPEGKLSRAARFLYLNRTCFNGMYRVNRQGNFNVPIGTKTEFLEDIERFEDYAAILRCAHIYSRDFVEIIRKSDDGDLVFADPPYTISHNQNSFIKYNENLFSWKDQIRLLNALVRARDRGSLIIATNAFYQPLVQMYHDMGFYTQRLNRFSSISGSTDGRKTQEELLITSYPVEI